MLPREQMIVGQVVEAGIIIPLWLREKGNTMVPRQPLVLKNVRLLNGRIADIVIRDGIVSHVGAGDPSADHTVDCTGLLVLPAAVDMHVHMRGGVQSVKEDWTTGTKSALAGGVTVVVDQPNSTPPVTTPDILKARVAEARTHACCHFAINSGVTPTTPLKAMWKAGAMAFGETFVAPSSYGDTISGQQLTPALGQISSLGALATIHAEEVGHGADTSLLTHDRIRSPDGELRAVQGVKKCNTSGCRLHFCHLSTKASVAAAPGTVEVTPHHLFLSREQLSDRDTLGKVNPPLRSEKERRALFSAWEQIDVIASDHAPHTRPEKQVPFPDAPSGIPGVETMVPLLLAQVLDKKICLPDLVMKTSGIPAALLGIMPAGFAVGNRGDFALYRKKAVPVDPGLLHSKCAWTPFEGIKAVFPQEVIMGGITVYKEHEFFPGNPVWLSGGGYLSRSFP